MVSQKKSRFEEEFMKERYRIFPLFSSALLAYWLKFLWKINRCTIYSIFVCLVFSLVLLSGFKFSPWVQVQVCSHLQTKWVLSWLHDILVGKYLETILISSASFNWTSNLILVEYLPISVILVAQYENGEFGWWIL